MAKIPTGLSSINSTGKNEEFIGQEIIAVRVKFVSLNGKDYPITWKKIW